MAESLQTERCALEAELARSQAAQEKLRDAQRLARIADWHVRAGSAEFTWSDEVPELLGLNPTVPSRGLDGLMACMLPADRDDFQSARAVFLASGVPIDVQFRVLTPTGEVRWMHLFSRAQRGDPASAGSLGRSGVMQDITRRPRLSSAF